MQKITRKTYPFVWGDGGNWGLFVFFDRWVLGGGTGLLLDVGLSRLCAVTGLLGADFVFGILNKWFPFEPKFPSDDVDDKDDSERCELETGGGGRTGLKGMGVPICSNGSFKEKN